MPDEPKPEDKRIGSRQDGEDPNRRTDQLSERANPGLHGGGGAPGWKPGDHPEEKTEERAPGAPEQTPGE